MGDGSKTFARVFMSMELFQYKTITPLASLGLTGKFWMLHIDTIAATWVAMLMLVVFILVGKIFSKRPKSIVAFGYQKIVVLFMDFYKDTFHSFNYNFFLFIVSLFFFTFFCCLVGILPFLHTEPTGDLNTTIAISLTSFLYIQYQKIAAHGIGGYLHEFIDPIFVLAPIHLVGELSKIASMAFRLFGNILGGSIIFSLIMQLVHTYQVPITTYLIFVFIGTLLFSYTSFYHKIPWLHKLCNGLTLTVFLLSWIQIVLGIGEGLIQSFVVTMLTATYLAIGTQHEESSSDHAVENKTKETAQ